MPENQQPQCEWYDRNIICPAAAKGAITISCGNETCDCQDKKKHVCRYPFYGWHTGEVDSSVVGIETRNKLGLPLKKQIVYYRDRTKEDSKVNVVSYRIRAKYNTTREWYEVELWIDNEIVNIHSEFLKQMQSPHFIKEQEERVKKNGYSDWFDW